SDVMAWSRSRSANSRLAETYANKRKGTNQNKRKVDLIPISILQGGSSDPTQLVFRGLRYGAPRLSDCRAMRASVAKSVPQRTVCETSEGLRCPTPGIDLDAPRDQGSASAELITQLGSYTRSSSLLPT